MGGQVAVELAKLRRVGRKRDSLRRAEKGKVVVVGASILDFTAKMKHAHMVGIMPFCAVVCHVSFR